jgi:hypothetical protein
VHVDSCRSHSSLRATRWFCTGSFTGDDGTSIPSVQFAVVRDEAPTDESAMVASADATHAYPPGNLLYGVEVIWGVAGVALGGLLLYWAFGGRLWRRDGAW